MPFISPLALAGLVFIPAVIAMYLLKLRRDQAVVPSTLLWSRLLTDVEANAPWQRLRRSLLLLIQLLLVLALVLLAARPFLERPAGLARDVVLVMDTSASMGATDVAPNRLAAARDAAMAALKDLPTGGKVSVIAADRTARIVVNETTDLGRVRQAIDDLRPAPDARRPGRRARARLEAGDPLRRGADPRRHGRGPLDAADRQGLGAGQGAARRPRPQEPGDRGHGRPDGAVRGHALGVHQHRQRRPRAGGPPHRAVGRRPAARGARRDARGAGARRRRHRRRPERRRDGRGAARLPRRRRSTTPDQLAVDDHAWAVLPAARTRLVLVVGEGDPYLETALSYLPNVELYGVAPKDYGASTQRTDGRPWDLTIFEGDLPATLPTTPILAIAPPRTSPLGEVTGTLKDPGIGSLDPAEPILRYVDLSTTHISAAQQLTTPDWARTVIPGPKGSPLLYTGVRAGLPTAVLAFEPRRSDLPLQVAFPILLSNLTGELLGGSTAPTDAVAPGAPVTLQVPAGATGVTRDPARRHDHRAGAEPGQRVGGDLRADRPAGHLHRHPDRRRRRVPCPVGRGRADAAAIGHRRRERRSVGVAGNVGRRRRPERAGPLRGRPVRPRRVVDRAGLAGRHRGARRRRPRFPAPPPLPGRRPWSARPPATSSGSRSC